MERKLFGLLAVMLMFVFSAPGSAEETTAKVWELPTAGMDITIPESWNASGYYMEMSCQEFTPGLIITQAACYAATEEELYAAAEKYGNTEEFNAYLEERTYDLLTLLSVDDKLGYDGMMAYWTEYFGVDKPEDLPFEAARIGKADRWTFYNLSGDIIRRPDPVPGTEETIQQILDDLPETYEKIRFYKAAGEPKIEEGTKLSFKTVDFEGNEVDSAELFGQYRYTLVNIWMSWCTYCVQEMPELEEMSQAFAEDSCGVIGIMLDGDQEDKLQTGKALAEEAGTTYPMLIATQEMKEQLIVTGYPTTVFVDSEGIVIGDPIKGMLPDQYRVRMQSLLNAFSEQETGEEMTDDVPDEAADKPSAYAGLTASEYRVIVQDEYQEPVPDVMIQFCSDTECMMGTTDADGVASFDAEAGAYTVHLLVVPEEYEEDPEEYEAPDTPGDVVITVKKK